MEDQLKRSVLSEQKISRDEMFDALRKDLTLAGCVINDVLRSKELLNALLDVMYVRYEKTWDARNAQPELPLNSADHDGL